jgi:hypothetical protein
MLKITKLLTIHWRRRSHMLVLMSDEEDAELLALSI